MSDFVIEDGTLVKCNIEKGDVTIPVGVRNIGFQAISGRLKSLTFPEGVEIIGEYAIRNFYYLTVYLPKSLKEIKANAFLGFYDSTKVVYAGTAEDFKKIKIATTGNRDFIKRMESQLGLESRFAPKAKTEKPAEGKTKKQRIAEYLENYAKENPVEYVNPQEVDLDSWHNVIVGHEGLFQFKENKSLLLVSGKTVSANCARYLGKMQMKNALNECCKYVTFNYAINPEKKVEAILDGKEPKWDRVYATSYKQVPMSVFTPLYKEGMQGCVLVKDGIIDVRFKENCDREGYAKIYMGDFPELPKQGKVQIPVRFRLLEGEIPTDDNIACSFSRGKMSFVGTIQESVEKGCEFTFCVGEREYIFLVEYFGQNGHCQAKDYRLGQDEGGHYIDVLLEMNISKDYSLY